MIKIILLQIYYIKNIISFFNGFSFIDFYLINDFSYFTLSYECFNVVDFNY